MIVVIIIIIIIGCLTRACLFVSFALGKLQLPLR